MIFVGIAIFTVFTAPIPPVNWDGKCHGLPSDWPQAWCDDYVKRGDERKEYQYMGEYRSLESCHNASHRFSYAPKARETVADYVETLCVPKNPP